MNTDQQPEIIPPATQSPAPAKKRGIVLPIILMVWPAVAIVAAILLYAIMNFIFGMNEQPAADGSLFAENHNPVRVITNVALFFVGGLGVGLGPISFIVGLVLLIMRLSK